MKLLLHHLNLACGAALLLACASLTPARTEPSPAPLQSPANVDRSKYAVIISGASGEPAYAKQFEGWTSSLRSALLGRFGFAEDRLQVLSEKPGAGEAPATAEE